MFSKVVRKFNDESSAVLELKTLLKSKQNLKAQLAFIREKFSDVSSAIKQLETANLPAPNALQIYFGVSEKLSGFDDHVTEKIARKFATHVAKNGDLKHILAAFDDSVLDESASDRRAVKSALFQYANLTSVDVERCFSRYKQIYNDRRGGFTFEGLQRYMFIHCNADKVISNFEFEPAASNRPNASEIAEYNDDFDFGGPDENLLFDDIEDANFAHDTDQSDNETDDNSDEE